MLLPGFDPRTMIVSPDTVSSNGQRNDQCSRTDMLSNSQIKTTSEGSYQ